MCTQRRPFLQVKDGRSAKYLHLTWEVQNAKFTPTSPIRFDGIIMNTVSFVLQLQAITSHNAGQSHGEAIGGLSAN